MTKGQENKNKEQKSQDVEASWEEEGFDVEVTETVAADDDAEEVATEPKKQETEEQTRQPSPAPIGKKNKGGRGKKSRKNEEAAADAFFSNTTKSDRDGKKIDVQTVNYGKVDREVKIQLMRMRKELDEDGNPVSHLPKAILDKINKPISSVLVNGKPLVGISRKEQEALLPEVLQESPGTVGFDTSLQNYFIEKSIRVDPNPAILRIGRTRQGDPVPLEGYVEDYINYKWALAHPYVGNSKKEARRNPLMDWYIYDPEEEKSERRQINEIRKRASFLYNEIRQDEDQVDTILKCFPNYISPTQLHDTEFPDKDDILFEIHQQYAEEFIRIAEDDDLEIYAELEEMVFAMVLERVGTKYYFMSDIIGTDKEKAAAFMKHPDNQATVQSMRRKLESYKEDVSLKR